MQHFQEPEVTPAVLSHDELSPSFASNIPSALPASKATNAGQRWGQHVWLALLKAGIHLLSM